MPRRSSSAAVAYCRPSVRNALPQILAMTGLQLGYLMGGSILVETIFDWPGTGFILNRAILTRIFRCCRGRSSSSR